MTKITNLILDTATFYHNINRKVKTVYLGPELWRMFVHEQKDVMGRGGIFDYSKTVNIYDLEVRECKEIEYFKFQVYFKEFKKKEVSGWEVNCSSILSKEQTEYLKQNIQSYLSFLHFQIEN